MSRKIISFDLNFREKVQRRRFFEEAIRGIITPQEIQRRNAWYRRFGKYKRPQLVEIGTITDGQKRIY